MLASTDPVFVACDATGPDPIRDGVFFIEAWAFPADEGPISVVPPTWLMPFQDLAPGAPLSRQLSDYGLKGDKLAQLELSADRLPELLQALAARPLVLASGQSDFLQRFRQFCPEAVEPTALDLSAFATLLHPSRGSRETGSLYQRQLGQPAPKHWRATDLRALCESLVGRHFDRPTSLRQLFARGFEELHAACQHHDPQMVPFGSNGGQTGSAAEWLELARRLLDRPSRFGAGQEELYRQPLADGLFGEDLEDSPLDPERGLADIRPEFQLQYELEFKPFEPLQDRLDQEMGLHPEDEPILEQFFDLVPRHFAKQKQGTGKASKPKPTAERPGQRALAHAIEETLAGNQFLIADAPTGTGKTLAYLAPMLMWAVRNQVRVGLSTYTRALQEQAFFREVPRALELLREAGQPVELMPRVSMLKGRANYICGRAIVDAAPEAGAASAVARATWLRLALYYCEDSSVDLDGFSLDPGVPLGNPARTIRAAGAMIGQVRAIPTCCHGKSALRCGAGVRSLRAERSHLVVSNHAFVLSRPEYFSHLLFDECDHLHEVTLSVRSYDIELDEVTRLAVDLQSGRGRDRAPLERLHRLMDRLAAGDKSEALQEQSRMAVEGTRKLDAAAHECTAELRLFREFQQNEGANRTAEERAFLLHEYLETGRGDGLATALHALKRAVDQLDSSLRWCIEELGEVPLRGARRLRWSLRRPLELLSHWREGLELWLGGDSEQGDFSDQFHYNAIFENRRRPMLVLKWILPQEWLGNVYYPSLRNAILVSATARLRDGFKAMKGYLGLDILEADTDVHAGRKVAEFVGPPTFDPKEALIAVPEDAPPYGWRGPTADHWMEYIEDSLLYLAERTRGRILCLFTNRKVLQRIGERLAGQFRARGIPLYWQGMPGLGKEDIMQRFRDQTDSVLLGVDTFWYGVDFPGQTCEYVIITKLPYGALDDYTYAQKARMGSGPHRNRIYLPKALAMFRQGCGRLLRNESDRGAVLILDRRALEKRHADFLNELPGGLEDWQGPNLLTADTDTCFQRIFAHMKLGKEIERRGLSGDFSKMRGQQTTPEA
jgi:ATP-dependent DNA helicase DinG